MTVAVYPGTFDPLTLGHELIVRRAARLFERVIVGVADSHAKRPIFDVEERVTLAREALSDEPRVQVERFSGLMVVFAQHWGASAVVRGLRGVSDFDYEFQLAGMNRQLAPQIETIFMAPAEGFQFVSGTLVREIAAMGGDISRFVSPVVAERIRMKLAKQEPRP
jgi:pantetheine-phosphate adenylyltransferase